MNPILIRTDRLLLRPWAAADADALLRLRAHPDVARWMADPTPWSDRRLALDTIEQWEAEQAAGRGLGSWALTLPAAPEPLGSVSLREVPNGDGEVEIGWMLAPDHWGHGYAREAAAAILTHGRGLQLPRIWALMWPGNESSARVCRAIGMQDLGVLPDPWYGGESHTFVVVTEQVPLPRPADRQAD